MSKLQRGTNEIRETPKNVATFAVFGLYMLLLAFNAVLVMTGSEWSTLNAGAVIALGAGLWYAM